MGIFIPILYMLEYINRHPIDHDIFNISNCYHKQISASNNQFREYRRENKQTITPLKLPIIENNLICLPTTEAETLVRVWFLLRERGTDLVREKMKDVGMRWCCRFKNKERGKERRTKKEFWCSKKDKEKNLGGAHVC